MLPDVESVWPVIVGRDLDRQSHSIANILDKLVSGSPITLSDLVRENELGVSVDATPKPIVPALCLVVFRKPTRMTADILPLLIHFNTTHAMNRVFADFEHATARANGCAFAERRQK